MYTRDLIQEMLIDSGGLQVRGAGLVPLTYGLIQGQHISLNQSAPLLPSLGSRSRTMSFRDLPTGGGHKLSAVNEQEPSSFHSSLTSDVWRSSAVKDPLALPRRI